MIIHFSTGQVLATIWALFLPSVKQSVYFHRPNVVYTNVTDTSSEQKTNGTKTEPSTKPPGACTLDSRTLPEKIRTAYYLLWKDFVKAYSNFHVLKWSFWWAVASCGYIQVLSYSPPLWQKAVEKDDMIYNGAVEALYSIIGKNIIMITKRKHLSTSLNSKY